MTPLLPCNGDFLWLSHGWSWSLIEKAVISGGNENERKFMASNLFVIDRCGHCRSLAPEWKKAASALKGVVKVGAVDMDVHSSVGSPYNVRGFPTIKVFGANKKSPSDYNGKLLIKLSTVL